MSDNIKNFSLSSFEGSRGYKRVLLQLFGLPGNGKSSFINSCKFVIDGGEFVSCADVADSDGGKTTQRISHELTESICMVDNRGMPKLNRFQTGEIFAQLGNLLPLNQEVEWVEDFNVNLDRIMADSFKEENLYDLIVPVLVHSVKYSIQNDVETYQELLNTARDLTGISPYIILTYKYHGGLKSMQSEFEDLGMKKIYSIENYTNENPMVVRAEHEEIIKFLTEVLEDVKFRMKHLVDPREQRQKHLKFTIKYIKDTSDMKTHEDYQKKKSEEESKNKKGGCVIM